MKREDVRLVDLAKQLRLGVSTVSKALNDYPGVNDYTRERVKALAKELNFIPNKSAVNLKKKSTSIIGIVVPILDDSFYIEVINGIEDYLNNHGYNVAIFRSKDTVETERKILELIKLERLDGLLISVSKNSTDYKHISHLQDIGIPVVLFARAIPDKSFFTVSSNAQQGIDQAIEFLTSKGHKRIAYINGPASLYSAQERSKAYLNAIRQQQITQQSAIIKSTDFSKESVEQAMAELFSTNIYPTAIITYKSMMALTAINYIKQNHSQLLSEIDFIGFSDSPVFEYLDKKPVAFIKEQPHLIGETAAQTLLGILNKELSKANPASILVDCNLITV